MSATAAGLPPWKPSETLTYRLPKHNAQTAALRAADAQTYFRKLGLSMEASNLYKLAYLVTGEVKPAHAECPVNMDGLSAEMALKFKDMQLIEERNTWLGDLDRKKTVAAQIHLNIDQIGQDMLLGNQEYIDAKRSGDVVRLRQIIAVTWSSTADGMTSAEMKLTAMKTALTISMIEGEARRAFEGRHSEAMKAVVAVKCFDDRGFTPDVEATVFMEGLHPVYDSFKPPSRVVLPSAREARASP